jgi:hypothetical protein
MVKGAGDSSLRFGMTGRWENHWEGGGVKNRVPPWRDELTEGNLLLFPRISPYYPKRPVIPSFKAPGCQ